MNMFESVQLIGSDQEKKTSNLAESINDFYNRYSMDIMSESGVYMKNVGTLVTPEMVMECAFNNNLIREAAILEGAKLDAILKNFLKEGKDYKGLKKDLREIIKANDMDDSALSTGKKGLMHTCKRILQVALDLGPLVSVAGSAGSIATTASGAAKVASFVNATGLAGAGVSVSVGAAVLPAIIGAIVGLIIGFIINRLLRLAVDTVEFKAVEGDARDIVDDLETAARKTEDPKLKKKYQDSADRLRESIKKYSSN